MRTTAIVIALGIVAGLAQMPKAPTLPADMSGFLVGHWTCHGHLPNGEPLDATISFAPLQGEQALLFHQDDVAPGNFHATGLGTVDRTTGKTVAFLQDNSGGARFFTSPEGWTGGQIILEDTPILGHAPFRERFLYQRTAAGGLRVDWEVGAPSGGWRLGDRNQCTRAAN